MAKLTVKQVDELARKILSDSPEGVRYAELGEFRGEFQENFLGTRLAARDAGFPHAFCSEEYR